ncbi:MAG: hypothetical protein H6807_00365 [Planctomycetes bacterium]|nr:hypothetical protein [Ilumatobacter sp.]MCB9830899.1 hypothetical protein [Planctomycetota bacterium]
MAIRLALAVAFRYLGFVLMTALAVWNEARPAPSLPDAVLDLVPYDVTIARLNYWIWVVAWMPATLWLMRRRPLAAAGLLYAGGWLSIIRGLCIVTTGLGPVKGFDPNAGLGASERFQGILAVANPLSSLFGDSAFVYLTKDLFFSGHVATTFLLTLWVWPLPRLRWWVLAGHLVVTASVFVSRLHYTIDVIGAYAITFSFFVLVAGDPRRRGVESLGPSWTDLKGS